MWGSREAVQALPNRGPGKEQAWEQTGAPQVGLALETPVGDWHYGAMVPGEGRRAQSMGTGSTDAVLKEKEETHVPSCGPAEAGRPGGGEAGRRGGWG